MKGENMVKDIKYVKKEYKNTLIKIGKESAEYQLEDVYRENARVLKQSLVVTLLGVFIWLVVGFTYLYVNKGINLISFIIIFTVSIVILCASKVMYITNKKRKEVLQGYIKGTLDVVIGEEDVIELDEENKTIFFRYNETSFKITNIEIKGTEEESKLVFKDNLEDKSDIKRFYNVIFYKNCSLDNKTPKSE